MCYLMQAFLHYFLYRLPDNTEPSEQVNFIRDQDLDIIRSQDM